MILVGTFGTAFLCGCLKRLLGRIRPGRDDAGKFVGPSLAHHNWRESFPSLHSASAVALSTLLARLYPPAAWVFWGLALVCCILRYVQDAHWPSDVTAGATLGYGLGSWAWAYWGGALGQ
jgi:undecaprenyl-diphosphatase